MKLRFTVNAVLGIAALFACRVTAQESQWRDADSNEDGIVALAEFEKYAGKKMQNFEQLKKFAAAVDSNANGVISNQEFESRFEVLQSMSKPGEGNEKSAITDAKNPNPADGNIGNAKGVFNKIKKLISQGAWEDAAKHMTKKAEQETITEQIVSAIAMTKMEMPVPVPQIDDAVDEIDNILIKYGLVDLAKEMPNMFSFKMSIDGNEDDADESSKDEGPTATGGKMGDMNAKVMKAVDATGKKWDVVRDIWKAKKSSPMAMSVWNGKITKHETDDKEKDVVFLVVEMAADNSDNGGGVVFQVVAPPSIIRMEKIDGNWLYNGNDPERTQKAMSAFMEQQGGFGGNGPPGKDF